MTNTKRKIGVILLLTSMFVLFFSIGTGSVLAADPQPIQDIQPAQPIQDIPANPVDFPNPLGSEVNTLYKLVQVVATDIIIPIGSVIVIIYIMFAGFKFVVAQGNTTKIEEAKKMLFYGLIGALILLGSWSIAQVVENTVNQITGNSSQIN